MTTQDAVSHLTNELKNDEGYYQSWKANIAMAFFDECTLQGSEMNRESLHRICNDAADRFLKQLIS